MVSLYLNLGEKVYLTPALHPTHLSSWQNKDFEFEFVKHEILPNFEDMFSAVQIFKIHRKGCVADINFS